MVLDGVETHTHHHHSSGHRIFDFVASGSAVLISCVSLFVAVQHGRTMEKLVEANSFPNVELGGGIAYTEKPDQLALDLSADNTGVGPGRIESIELWENGKPVRSAADMLATIKAAANGEPVHAELQGGTIIESLLGAGKTKSFVRFKLTGKDKWFPILTKIVIGLESRVCYCSVFEECHISDSRLEKGRPTSVKQCPKPAAAYDDNFTTLAMSQSLANDGR